ncbi:MAG: ABC transporter permease [Candidatus Micrarchaeia archaeon]
MGLYRDTIALYKRELIIFRRHLKTNIIRGLLFPTILILIFGSMGSNAAQNVPAAIVNYANNPSSVSFINALENSGSITVEKMTTEADAFYLLHAGKVSMVIVIAPTFPANINGNPAVEVYYSTSNFVSSSAAVGVVESTAQGMGSKVDLQSNAPTVQANIAYANAISYKDFLIGGIIVMVAVFGSTFGGGMSLISDRQLGNYKAFMITPINKSAVLLSKIIYSVTVSIFYSIVALGIGLLDGVTIAMGFVGFIWIVILSGMVSLGFSAVTVVLASRISKIDTFSIAANMITLPLWFLSGAFFPASALPSFLQPISSIDPMTYATSGIRYVMISGYYPQSAIILDLAFLGGFFIISFFISMLVSKSTID